MLSLLSLGIALAVPVVAQDQSFLDGFLAYLNSQNLTELASIIQTLDPKQAAFLTSISGASNPKTFFAPTNDNLNEQQYEGANTTFLDGLLLYHLVPGTWTEGEFSIGPNHSILSTELTGHQLSFLEGDRSQVIVCSVVGTGMSIFNQQYPTTLSSPTIYQYITIFPIDHVIDFPGKFSSEMTALADVSVTRFLDMQQFAAESNLENAFGFTAFVFTDIAYNSSESNLSGITSQSLFDNHVIMGQTIWSDTFISGTYTSASGHQYTFSFTPSGGYMVTLGASIATVIRSDILTDNGVFHLIDNVLWDTPNVTTSGLPTATDGSSSASGIGGSWTGPKFVGTIAGATIGAMVLTIVTLGFFLQRRHRRRVDPDMSDLSHHGTILDLSRPQPGGPPSSPGDISCSYRNTASGPTAPHCFPSPPSVAGTDGSSEHVLHITREHDTSPAALASTPTSSLRKVPSRPFAARAYQSSVGGISEASHGSPQHTPATVPDQPEQRPDTVNTDMPNQVVDRLLERFVRRIDIDEQAEADWDEVPPYRSS